jgi:predicted dehydrogenase
VRLGLIGCGWAGATRAAAVVRLAGFQLVAVSDADGARAQALAERYRAVAEPRWRSLVQREDLDVVIVSTPPPLHAEMGITALDYGKHVLCEKPLARTPDECRSILEAARRSGRVLGAGFNYRFYPAIARAREILDAGVIGELDHVRSYAGHPGGSEFTHAWVHDAAVMGGGTLMDNGIHLIDLTRYFLGEVAEVKGYATGSVWRFPGCEDNGFGLLRSPSGKVGYLQASWSEWCGYRFAVEVYGTQGCVRASYPPMMTQLVRRAKPGGRTRRRVYLFPQHQVMERLHSYRWTTIQSFTKELTAFAQTIAGQETALALGLDGLKSVEIAHAVYQDAKADRDPSSVLLCHELP